MFTLLWRTVSFRIVRISLILSELVALNMLFFSFKFQQCPRQPNKLYIHQDLGFSILAMLSTHNGLPQFPNPIF